MVRGKPAPVSLVVSHGNEIFRTNGIRNLYVGRHGGRCRVGQQNIACWQSRRDNGDYGVTDSMARAGWPLRILSPDLLLPISEKVTMTEWNQIR